MALTQEQIQQARLKYGIVAPSAPSVFDKYQPITTTGYGPQANGESTGVTGFHIAIGISIIILIGLFFLLMKLKLLKEAGIGLFFTFAIMLLVMGVMLSYDAYGNGIVLGAPMILLGGTLLVPALKMLIKNLKA